MRRILFGDRPRAVLLFASPTFLAVLLDCVLRPRSLAAFPPKEWLNYFGSTLASAGFWSGPIWLASRLFCMRGRAAAVGIAAFGALFLFPFALFSFGGQILYFEVFHAYMARDTVRLGIALRGTLGAWLASWGGSLVTMALFGVAVTAAALALARRGAKPAASAWPLIPIAGFSVATYCFWIDFVESRSLQAAPPDTCFIHGVVHALRDGLTGKGWVRRGITLREPVRLPALAPAVHRPSIVLIVTESVRADAVCSQRTAECRSAFLDEAAPDRIALGRLTAQSSGTFTSCVLLWTGLGPDADMATMHRVPVVWEVARAAGYRTAYIGSQNLRYDNFGAFLQNAGIDLLLGAADLGDAGDAHIGAPDENATARVLAFVRAAPPGVPYFAVLHLSNTHWPYRVRRDLQPHAPHDDSPLGDVQKLHNHYRNSVLLQEKTVSEFIRALRSLPGWDDTLVVFVSDHGEEFREHGGLYHLTSLFDEQVRIPGWILSGDRALTAPERAALAAYAGRRTYTQDVHATLIDAMGVDPASLPLQDRVAGRSLLRPPPADEPIALLSTASGVWEPDVTRYGAARGDLLAVRSASPDWACFDAGQDPSQHTPVALGRCADLVALATRRFHLADGASRP